MWTTCFRHQLDYSPQISHHAHIVAYTCMPLPDGACSYSDYRKFSIWRLQFVGHIIEDQSSITYSSSIYSSITHLHHHPHTYTLICTLRLFDCNCSMWHENHFALQVLVVCAKVHIPHACSSSGSIDRVCLHLLDLMCSYLVTDPGWVPRPHVKPPFLGVL